MKLIVYETSHYEILPALLTLASREFERIHVFLPRHSFDHLSPTIKNSFGNLIQWTIQEKVCTNRDFIRQLFKELERGGYSHLHISTLDHNMLFFALHLLRFRRIQCSLTVHSIHEYLSNYRDSVKAISETMAKIILRRRINHYRVLVPAMVSYLKALLSRVEVVYLPGELFDPSISAFKKPSDSYFTILIPGTVEQKRRDYAWVIHFFSNELNHLTRLKPIKLVLGGSAATDGSRQIIRRLKQLENELFTLVYSDEPLSQQAYRDCFAAADIVWNPIPLLTLNRCGYPERSGISHSPGFFTDQLHYGCCAILPDYIHCPEPLLAGNFTYNNESALKAIIEDLITNPESLLQKQQEFRNICAGLNEDYFEADFQKLTCQPSS